MRQLANDGGCSTSLMYGENCVTTQVRFTGSCIRSKQVLTLLSTDSASESAAGIEIMWTAFRASLLHDGTTEAPQQQKHLKSPNDIDQRSQGALHAPSRSSMLRAGGGVQMLLTTRIEAMIGNVFNEDIPRPPDQHPNSVDWDAAGVYTNCHGWTRQPTCLQLLSGCELRALALAN